MLNDKKIPNREKRKSLFYKFEVLNSDGQFIGYLGDITLNGLKVISANSIEINSIHNLKIKLPSRISNNEEINFEAKCVWCKNDDEAEKYQLGFKANFSSKENINTIKIIMELLASPDEMIL